LKNACLLPVIIVTGYFSSFLPTTACADPALPEQLDYLPSAFVFPQAFSIVESQEIPDFLTLQNNKATIGEIIVKRNNVFDLNNPDENIAIFRLANRLHIMTQESVIRNQLLFKTGDYFSQQALDESERLLRNSSYIYDAHIHPIRYHDNVVDIEVETRDVWTLKGSISFSREGGSNSLSADIQESNLIGYGKDLRFSVGTDVDRKQTLLAYKDTQFFNSRNELSLLYNDKSDGVTQSFDLSRPFYSLQSKWTMGLSYFSDKRVDSLYEFGEINDQFKHHQKNISVYGGISEGYINNLVYRWRLGYSEDRDYFLSQEDYPLGPVPEDRDFRYPWVSFEVYEDRIIKTTHITQINRTEDLNLGNEINVQLGWSGYHTGALNEGLIFDIKSNMAFRPLDANLLLLNSYVNGQFTQNNFENTLLGFNSNLYIPNFGQQVFFMSLKGEYLERPYLDHQILLGGDSGLRGYPLRYQSGDRMLLFTLEQRLYTSWHWFQLAYVGALAFYDIGRAWSDNVPENDKTGVLRDVGLGLRLASSRSARGIVFHADLAFPLDGDSSISEVQLVLTTQESF